MSTIEVAVAGRGIQVKQGYEKPSAGDVNTCSVSLAIESGGVWDSLPHKRVTFATRTASVTVDYAPTIAIPHEVMASPGALYLTLTGYDADGIEVARTHRMTYPIEVARAGADEGAEPSPATLDVVSRIDNIASTLEASETTRQEAFESAQNERSSAFQASMSEWQQDVAESVSHASNAATLANEAATNANNAATNANEAAANANEAAVNANETANTIKQRADSGEFNGEPGADGYSPTASVTKNGGTATITVTDKNGTTTATVSDGAPGKDGSDATATDVRIAGKSITADGVANIPIASNTNIGLVKLWEYGGLVYGEAGLETVPASEATISARNGSHYCIPADSRLDYAVKAAMCDGKGAAWTAAEQVAAKKRMGIDTVLVENVLVGSETGSVAHVEDALAGASMREITVEGACKQDGTPSPDNPVPIQVIENPVVKVTGADTSTVNTSLAFTLPAEHPYLAKLPDGTADEIVVDRNGNVILIARVAKAKVPDNTTWTIQESKGYSLGYSGRALTANGVKKNVYDAIICEKYQASQTFKNEPCIGITDVLWIVPRTNSGDITVEEVVKAANGMTFYAPLAEEARYQLGRIEMPKAQDSIVNVWTDAEVTPNTAIEYVRDVNIVIGNIEKAIASITQG